MKHFQILTPKPIHQIPISFVLKENHKITSIFKEVNFKPTHTKSIHQIPISLVLNENHELPQFLQKKISNQLTPNHAPKFPFLFAKGKKITNLQEKVQIF